MASKHKIRELAMQMLFLWDSHGEADALMARQIANDTDIDPASADAALALAQAAWDQRDAADRWVNKVAPQWPTHRQPAVDRNVLRLGVWELTSERIDARIVLDEAIELAKAFSTEQSARFVNGVLDAILKEHRAMTSGAPLIVESSDVPPPAAAPEPDAAANEQEPLTP